MKGEMNRAGDLTEGIIAEWKNRLEQKEVSQKKRHS
jgi:hypothetical protein